MKEETGIVETIHVYPEASEISVYVDITVQPQRFVKMVYEAGAPLVSHIITKKMMVLKDCFLPKNFNQDWHNRCIYEWIEKDRTMARRLLKAYENR